MFKCSFPIKYRPAGMPEVRDDGKTETRSWVIDISGYRMTEVREAARAAWDAMSAAGNKMLSERP